MLGLQRVNIPGKLMVKLFSKNSNLCDHDPPTLQNGTDCALENEGSHVIGEFVDGRGVQFWNCRREGSCHMAKH